MSRRADLPSADQVRHAVHEITKQAKDIGQRPSVLRVAQRFGLSNTTFRRNFPDIAREIGETRRLPDTASTENSPQASRHVTLQERNAQLRRDNTALSEHLDLAVANIMRLTLDNQRLREELESATKVTRITQERNRS